MGILIVYAHPGTGGFCCFTLKTLVKKLSDAGIEFEVLDLYAMGYDPVLADNEHYTRGNRDVDEINLSFQKKIMAAQSMFFIYPVWWNTMPAILKGFFDRVLTPGFAYRFGSMGIPKRLLSGKRAIVFQTLGSPTWLYSYFIGGKRCESIIKKDILGFTGINARVYQTYNAKELDEKRKAEIEKKVDRGLKWLI